MFDPTRNYTCTYLCPNIYSHILSSKCSKFQNQNQNVRIYATGLVLNWCNLVKNDLFFSSIQNYLKHIFFLNICCVRYRLIQWWVLNWFTFRRLFKHRLFHPQMSFLWRICFSTATDDFVDILLCPYLI